MDVVIAILSLVSLVAALVAIRAAMSTRAWRKRINDLSDAVAVLEDSMEVVRGLAKRQGARYAKRDQRAAADGLPDPSTDPQGWLKAKQLEINQGKFGRKH